MDVLGDVGLPLSRLCREASSPALQGCPAVTFADLEKVFGRIGHTWFRDVLRGWQLPEWAMNVGCALICGRSVAAR
eukprot:11154520-Lingulodinium_polyedra.AAC.1